MVTTYWTKEPSEAPLYSDWKVLFTTTSDSDQYSKSNKNTSKFDSSSSSVSTSSLSSSSDESEPVGVIATHKSHKDWSSCTVCELKQELKRRGLKIPSGTSKFKRTDLVSSLTENDSELVIDSSADIPTVGDAGTGTILAVEDEQKHTQQHQEQRTSFAVHRNMIGPRSEFFTKTFLSMNASSPHDSSKNVIHLPSNLSKKAFNSLVEAFEAFLDFCYDGTTTKLTTDNAVAMYCLCNYLEIDQEFCNTVQDFITNDLNQSTVATYYHYVKELRLCATSNTNHTVGNNPEENDKTDDDNDDDMTLWNVKPIHEMVSFLCYKYPAVLSPPPLSECKDDSTSLCKIADLSLWLSIGSLISGGNSNDDIDNENTNMKSSEEEASRVWSENLTLFFDSYERTIFTTDATHGHMNDLNSTNANNNKSTNALSLYNFKESFRILTNDKVLPIISEKVALRLLHYERQHGLELCVETTTAAEAAEATADSSVLVEKAKKFKDYNGGNDDTTVDTSMITESGHSKNDDEIDRVIGMTTSVEADGVHEEEKEDDDDDEKHKHQQHKHTQQNNLNKTTFITNLQHRCIQALSDNNWRGEVNDVCKIQGKLTQITTPTVLEALLIGSVTGERKLGKCFYAIQDELKTERSLRAEDRAMDLQQINTSKVELLKLQQKQSQLALVLDEESKKREAAERKVLTFDLKLNEDMQKLQRLNAKLEDRFDEEKKRSYSLDLRYRALEVARERAKTDREMLELTCKEVITRLDAMSSQEEWWNNTCSFMSPLILMLSTMHDRRECEKIKSMISQAVDDPSSYERNYLLKNVNEDGEDVTVCDSNTMKDDNTYDDDTMRTRLCDEYNDDDAKNIALNLIHD